MLFLGIDQHARQLTISLRDQQGDVLLARQVSSRPAKILQFFDQLTQRCAEHNGSFIAVLEGLINYLIGRWLEKFAVHLQSDFPISLFDVLNFVPLQLVVH